MTTAADRQAPISDASFSILAGATTLAVMTFLVWVVYFNEGVPGHATATSALLPRLNAILNGLSAVWLVAGLVAVKTRHYRLHAALMTAAVVTSACFLASYVYYHLHHGDTPYLDTGLIRPIYFAILSTHVLLSMATFPMILVSLFLAGTRRFGAHRRLSRYTWVIWMYVSVTGVGIYWLLHA